MNRYGLAGLISDARRGRRVVVLSASQDDARAVFQEVEPALQDEAARVLRTNGRERIELRNGGRVDFRSARSTGGRGMSADLVILDGVESSIDAEIMIAGSRVGEIVHV